MTGEGFAHWVTGGIAQVSRIVNRKLTIADPKRRENNTQAIAAGYRAIKNPLQHG